MTTTIANRTTGKRMIMGTNHPIETYVNREVKFGRPVWILYESVCNGICEKATSFKTKKEAISAFNEN